MTYSLHRTSYGQQRHQIALWQVSLGEFIQHVAWQNVVPFIEEGLVVQHPLSQRGTVGFQGLAANSELDKYPSGDVTALLGDVIRELVRRPVNPRVEFGQDSVDLA